MKDRFGIDWDQRPGQPFWRRPLLGRRMFFRTAASLGGYFLFPGLRLVADGKLARPLATAKNCIFIMLSGGPSHVDTFDLKVGSWTPSSFQPESFQGLLFPRGLMPKLAERLEHLVLVRSAKSWAAVHSLAQTWVQIGRSPLSPLGKISPHIGAVVSLEFTPQQPDATLPVFVAFNGATAGAGYFPSMHAPLQLTANGAGLSNATHPQGMDRFRSRRQLLAQLDHDWRNSSTLSAGGEEVAAFEDRAVRIMSDPRVAAAFQTTEPDRARYGGTLFGSACLTAKNLLQAGLGTRFIQITLGGWDHHSNIYAANSLAALSKQLDDGLGALLDDLKATGLLDDTLVVALGEFGRTVGALNSQGGRDHHLQQSVLFAGGKIKGGRAIGSTDAAGAATAEPGWSRQRDIRPEDIEATIYSALGIDWTTIRRDDPLGRGFEYVPFADRDYYGPLHELWR